MCLALPGQVLSLEDGGPVVLGAVDFGGTRREVCAASIPDAAVGGYVTVHVGVARTRVDEASASETLAMFHDPGLLDDLGPDPTTVAAA